MSRHDDHATNDLIIGLGVILIIWLLASTLIGMLRSRASDKPRATKSRPALCHSTGGSCAPRPAFPETI